MKLTAYEHGMSTYNALSRRQVNTDKRSYNTILREPTHTNKDDVELICLNSDLTFTLAASH